MTKNIKSKKNIMIVACIAIIISICLFFLFFNKKDENKNDVLINLGNDLVINSIGQYSGKYYEDGSNEEVNNILAIKVTNNGEKTLQYCEIVLSGKNETAGFTLSTLKPNESIIVLESNRKSHSENTYKNGIANNVVFFNIEPTLLEDTFKISELDGALNVKNISNKDINSDIYIYYKNYFDNTYYGGITYRCKIEGGIKSGELKQIMTSHYSTKYSKIMFIDIVGQ